jgi:hypothetical protein
MPHQHQHLRNQHLNPIRCSLQHRLSSAGALRNSGTECSTRWRESITLGLNAVGSLTMMNLRALKTAFRVSVRFSQSWHMHASLQKSPAPLDSVPQLEGCSQFSVPQLSHWGHAWKYVKQENVEGACIFGHLYMGHPSSVRQPQHGR